MSANIRNFCIIAHIDHGKSTLADRLLEITGTIEKRQMKEQYLDQLESERERGITIKMAPVRMAWHSAQISADNNADQRGLLYEDLTYKIRKAIFDVYNKLGPSYKEIIYGNALVEELKKNNLAYEREKMLDVIYDSKKIGVYRPDFIVDDKVILEIKAQPFIGKLEIKQVWHYLKGSNYRLALLVNFGSKNLQIERIVYDTIRDNPHLDQRKSAQIKDYVLNLIDTPGHSDFSYEVSRALAAVEGAVLLVDVSQGIQAQTLANYENAKRAGLKIIGAVNKIDLDLSNTEEVVNDLANLIGVSSEEILKVSGKTGEGVEGLLEAVIERVPPPSLRGSSNNNENDEAIFSSGKDDATEIASGTTAVGPRNDGIARALIFDSLYDDHKGIIAFVRVFDGQFKRDDQVKFLATGAEVKIKEVGYFYPQLKTCPQITSGEIGYIATGVKEFGKIKIGDTVVKCQLSNVNCQNLAMPDFREPQPVVFVSFYPEESDDYENLKQALSKLKLTDAALIFEPDTSEMLGRGFKGGFLGRLHFEITAERLEKEFNIRTVHSFPSVAYRVRPRGSTQINIQRRSAQINTQISADNLLSITNPKDFPDDYLEAQEPMVKIEVLTPSKYIGGILALSEIFRLTDIQTNNLGTEKILVTAKLPLADLISDFDDKLKSLSAGYASLSYEIIGYEKGDLEKMEILVAGHIVPGLTRILPKEKINYEARQTVERLRELLPKQQFVQAIQAAVRGKIIARETIAAMRKDVTGYLYGGDRTRKMKLWKKQQKGKAKLKERAEGFGGPQIKIPAHIFKELLKK